MELNKICSNCINVTTLKGKQCGTLTRKIENIHPFNPENVIETMNNWAKECNRYSSKDGRI